VQRIIDNSREAPRRSLLQGGFLLQHLSKHLVNACADSHA
jgi:hypothetical protein